MENNRQSYCPQVLRERGSTCLHRPLLAPDSIHKLHALKLHLRLHLGVHVHVYKSFPVRLLVPLSVGATPYRMLWVSEARHASSSLSRDMSTASDYYQWLYSCGLIAVVGYTVYTHFIYDSIKFSIKIRIATSSPCPEATSRSFQGYFIWRASVASWTENISTGIKNETVSSVCKTTPFLVHPNFLKVRKTR